jgi:hypothetical protein
MFVSRLRGGKVAERDCSSMNTMRHMAGIKAAINTSVERRSAVKRFHQHLVRMPHYGCCEPSQRR